MRLPLLALLVVDMPPSLFSRLVSCRDKEIDQFSDFVVVLTKAVKVSRLMKTGWYKPETRLFRSPHVRLQRNLDIAKGHADKMATGIKREYTKISAGFKVLSEVFSQGGGQVKNGSMLHAGTVVPANCQWLGVDNVRLAQAFIMAAGEIEDIAGTCCRAAVGCWCCQQRVCSP